MKLVLKSPLKIFRINQKFGENANAFYKQLGLKGHNGIDFFAPDSTEVYAAHDGRVTFAGYDGSGGLGIVIRTEEEFDYLKGQSYFKSIYWHLRKDSLKVTGSQQVKAGDLIALSDNTGMSTGAHLHFGLKPIAKGENDWTWFNTEQDNEYMGAIDPLPYFAEKFQFIKTLRFGMLNSDVKELQKILGVIQTGFFGTLTLEAVKKFQRKYEIPDTGLVGELTRTKLNLL